MSDVDHYLSQFIARDVRCEEATDFFKRNVKRWIVNNPELLQQTRHVTTSDPEWAHTAHRDGLLYDFVGSTELSERLSHIADGFRDIAAKQPELLSRFRTLSIDGAQNVIDEFYARQAKDVVPTGEGEEPIIQYRDGSRWVRLTSEAALKYEGSQMGHCVGGYRIGNGEFYSFRDPRNQSHVTIHAHGKSLDQVKGKGNREPVSRYMPMVIDFLNKEQIQKTCGDLQRYDVVKSALGQWKMFDPESVESIEVDGCELRFIKHYVYIRRAGYPDAKLTVKGMNYDPDVPFSVYAYVIKNADGSIQGQGFDLDCLMDSLDHLKVTVEQLALMEPKTKWRYYAAKGVEYVVHGPRMEGQYDRTRPYYFVKDTRESQTKYYTPSDYTNKLPDDLLMTLALKLSYPINPSDRLNILGSMPAAKANEYAKKLKSDGSSASYTLSSPLMKQLPAGLKVPNSLFVKPECGIKKLPDNLTVARDLNLRGTNVVALGDNTHVKRNLRLGGSKVKKLPSGLVIGGSKDANASLDLRGSLITSVPEDLQLIPRPITTNQWGRTSGGDDSKIVIAPGQNIRIPKALQPFVKVAKERLENTDPVEYQRRRLTKLGFVQQPDETDEDGNPVMCLASANHLARVGIDGAVNITTRNDQNR